MNILIVGSGGREHALAWKLRQSAAIDRLYVAPGNAGTSELAENLPVGAEDSEGLLAAAGERAVDLTVVGPEAPLALGIVDRFAEAGRCIFGPSRAAAQLEANKVFAKDLMARYGIPTAAYHAFDRYGEALAYARSSAYPLVVKASGLAAGKGVTVCREPREAEEALRRSMAVREFGAAGDQVVIEECLTGQEASVLAFTDGETVRPMVVAQDHKPLLDGDRGPNTGGMGAYAPAGIVPAALLERITATILQPTVDALRNEGIVYRGVLYAGLMLTAQGPQVLEFNGRFGDPETQVILPLLEGDLLPILLACLDGSLARVPLVWSPRYSLCVVVAAQGYPGTYRKGLPITGLEAAAAVPEAMIFHAGTQLRAGQVITAGGRVLGVTAVGDTLAEAAGRAYTAAERVQFEGAYYRRDIGAKALRQE